MALAELVEYPYRRATSAADACAVLAERAARGEETVLLAGGTDWIVERHVAPATPKAPSPGERALVLDVARLPELSEITVAGDTARIGAGVPYLAIRRHPVLAERCPLLPAMAKDVGAIQIQARGTLGGNLATASPAADGVAALAALDATIVLQSVRGERRVPLAGYYTGYKRSVRAADELIARVELALPRAGTVQRWRKVGTRLAQAISKVALAGVAEVADGRVARIGLGMASVAPTTALLPAVRALALSRPVSEISDASLDEATARDVSPIDDVRSTAAYRLHVAKALVRSFFSAVRAATSAR